MNITITLDSELETRLRVKAAQQGKDIGAIAAELLTSVLAWEEEDLTEAIQGIQQGLDDFEAGRFRSFQDFAEEKAQ